MPSTGFAPTVGTRFTYQTTPAGEWDGVIHCRVLDAPLDTVVTFKLSAVAQGTRLRLVHSGFVLPRNETAFAGMGEGWKQVVQTVGDIAGEQD